MVNSELQGQATRLNLYEEHAREKIGAQPEWKLFHWECFPHTGETIYVQITGAVCLEKFKSGKRKGFTNWRKLIPETRRTVVLPILQHEQWELEWEKETGFCKQCTGAGDTFKSWSVTEGTKYRQCSRCAGSGKAPPVPSDNAARGGAGFQAKEKVSLP